MKIWFRENKYVYGMSTLSSNIQDGLWGTVDRELRDDRVWVYPCPYGYCRCFMMTASGETVCGPVVDTRRLSDQCDCDRMGEEGGRGREWGGRRWEGPYSVRVTDRMRK